MTKCSMERIVKPNKKENMLIEAVKDHHSERDGSGYKSKKINHKALESLAASIHEIDKRRAMSHMDYLIMLAKQCGIVKENCNMDVYQVIEGTVLDAIRHLDLGCEQVGGYNFKRKGYTLRQVREPSANLEIKIKNNSPVKTLIFNGAFPLIEKGQHILAAIYIIQESGDSDLRYVRDNLKEKEFAEIIKVIEKGEVVATYQNL